MNVIGASSDERKNATHTSAHTSTTTGITSRRSERSTWVTATGATIAVSPGKTMRACMKSPPTRATYSRWATPPTAHAITITIRCRLCATTYDRIIGTYPPTAIASNGTHNQYAEPADHT